MIDTFADCFEGANLLAIHAKRVTIFQKDMEMARKIGKIWFDGGDSDGLALPGSHVQSNYVVARPS